MPVARDVRVFPIGGVRFVSFGGARASRRSDIAEPLLSSPIQLVSTGRGVAFAANRKKRFAANRSAICRSEGRGAPFAPFAPFAIFDDDTDATSLDMFTDVSDDDHDVSDADVSDADVTDAYYEGIDEYEHVERDDYEEIWHDVVGERSLRALWNCLKLKY